MPDKKARSFKPAPLDSEKVPRRGPNILKPHQVKFLNEKQLDGIIQAIGPKFEVPRESLPSLLTAINFALAGVSAPVNKDKLGDIVNSPALISRVSPT
jgi:hypothetical protein